MPTQAMQDAWDKAVAASKQGQDLMVTSSTYEFRCNLCGHSNWMSWEGGTFPDPCDCEHTMVQWEEGMPRMWKPGTVEQETLVHAPDCEACWAIDVFVINAGHRDPMGPVAGLQGETKPVAA